MVVDPNPGPWDLGRKTKPTLEVNVIVSVFGQLNNQTMEGRVKAPSRRLKMTWEGSWPLEIITAARKRYAAEIIGNMKLCS